LSGFVALRLGMLVAREDAVESAERHGVGREAHHGVDIELQR